MVRDALKDIRTALHKRALWLALAREDIGDQHRETILGPLWILLNYLLYVGAFLIIFGDRTGVSNFPLYVSTGMLIWLVMQDVVLQGVMLFRRETRYIKGTTLPLTVYIAKLTFQVVIRFAYAAVGWIFIAIYLGFPADGSFLFTLAGLLVVMSAIPGAITIFAIGGAYFPDLIHIVNNLMRIGMFLTPIFWAPLDHGVRSMLYVWNPFTHFLEVVRQPLLTGTLPMLSLGVSLTLVAILSLIALILLSAVRRRIAYLL